MKTPPHVIANLCNTMNDVAARMEFVSKHLGALDMPYACQHAVELFGAAQTLKQWALEIQK
jgi:hypothetical protein